MIFSTIQDGFASVMASLGMVESDISEINSHLQHIDSDLEAIHGDLTSLAAIDEDLHMIHDDLAAIDTDLHMIHEDLTTLHNDLDAIGASVAQSTTGIAPLSEAIQANSAAINTLSDKLDMISEAVGAVQTSVETEATAAAATPTTLHSGETKQAVAVADFAGDVKTHPNDMVYKTSNTFSCDGDVFLSSASTNDEDGDTAVYAMLRTALADDTLPKSSITVEGFNLYKTFTGNEGNIAAGQETDIQEIGSDRYFDNRFLPAGTGVVIKGSTDQSMDTTPSVHSVDGTVATNTLWYTINNDTEDSGTADDERFEFTIQDYVNLKTNKATLNSTTTVDTSTNYATKSQLGKAPIYTITMKWFSASPDTTCTITSAAGSDSGLDETGKTVLVGLSIEDDDATKPSAFTERTVDCNGETTEITAVAIRAGGDILEQFMYMFTLFLTKCGPNHPDMSAIITA